jgi:RND superfamily putative drug exporter
MASDQPTDSPTDGQELHGGALHDAHSRGGIRLRRWVVPGLVVLFWLFVVGPLGSFAGQLSDVQENDAAGFLPASAESTQVRELSQGFSTSDTLPAIVVYEFTEQIGPADLAAVSSDMKQIATVRGVTEPVVGPIPSEDGMAVTVIANLQLDPDEEPGTQVQQIRALLAESPALALGATIYVTGPAGVLADFAEAFGEIDGILLLVALGVVLLILLIVYRSPVLPFIVLTTSILALGAASFVVYVLAETDVITLNGQSQGILFILVIGATTDYSLLLVARFREELRRTEYQVDAMRATLKGTAAAILASGSTVILGVMTLVLSELNSNRGLGPVAAVGIAFAMLAALTFLPAVLVMLGRKAFWPVRPKVDLTHPQAQVTGFWARVATTVDRKPRVVLLGSSAVLLALCAFVPMFKAEGVPQSDFFLVSVESTEGQDALARHFPAGSGSETLVIGPQELAAEMTSVITANAGVAAVVPQVAGPPGPDSPPLVVDGNVLLQVTLVDQADSAAAEQTVEELRSQLDAVSTEALVGGTTAIQLDTKAAAQRDLQVIIPAVLLVTLIVLILLLRAIVAPLVLIATVIVSFAATIGLSAIVFYTILDLPGADASVPLFAFVFLAALGVDYNIFLMTRAREETLKHGNRAGMLRALAVTGGVITSAGIVLAATFSALALLPLLFLFEIAFMVAAGVLIDTLIVRSLVVPSTVIVIGPRTWWPSRLARDAHDLDEAAALEVAITGEEE